MNIRDKGGWGGLELFAFIILAIGTAVVFNDLMKQGEEAASQGPEVLSAPLNDGTTNQYIYKPAVKGTTSDGVQMCLMLVFLCVFIPFVFKMICNMIGAFFGGGG